jgi:hypothetical protein
VRCAVVIAQQHVGDHGLSANPGAFDDAEEEEEEFDWNTLV